MNKRVLLSLAMFLFLVPAVLGATATNSTCGEVNADLILNQSIATTGSCFVINASHITLDGAGFSITGDNTGRGINITDYLNVTIKNFGNIEAFNPALRSDGMNDSRIINNSFNPSTGAFGVILSTSDSNNFSNNHVAASLTAVLVSTADNNFFSGNNITTNASSARGFQFQTTSLANAVIDNDILTTGTDAYGVYFSSTGTGTVVTGNRINVTGANGRGVFVQSTTSVNATYNVIRTAGTNGFGIQLSGASTCVLKYNNITTFGSSGIGLQVESSANTNTLIGNNISTYNDGGRGISIDSSQGSTMANNTIFTNHTSLAFGIYLANGDNNQFTRDKVTAGSQDLYVTSTSTGNDLFNVLLSDSVNFSTSSINAVTVDVNTTPFNDPVGRTNLSYYLTVADLGAGSINFNVSYTQTDVAGIEESTIRMYQYNGTVWNILAASTVDALTNYVSSGAVSSFSMFAPFGNVSIPTSNITFPPNGTFTNNATPVINFTLTDAADAVINFTVFVDGSPDGTGGSTNGTTKSVVLSQLTNGTHIVVVEARNDAGQSTNSTPLTITVDTINPTSVITSPANNTFTVNATPVINFTLTDNIDPVINFTLFVDGNATNTGGSANGTATIVALSELTNGTHTIKVEARDDAGNAVNSTPLIITVDTVSPTSTINSPANDTSIADSTPEINFTLTDNVDLQLNFTLFLDGAANITGAANNDTDTLVNLSALSDGTYTIVVEARDDTGNAANSTPLILTIDTTNPTSTINSPANNTITTDNSTEINFTLTDADLVINFTVFVDGSPDITGGVNNNTSTLVNISEVADGTHRIEVEAVDDAGNAVNSTAVFIVVDVTAPTSIITSPANNTLTSDTTPEITFNVTDGVDTVVNFTVFVDGTANLTGGSASGSLRSVNLSVLSDGNHTIVVEARDDANNSANSTAIIIPVDSTPPAVFAVSPTAGSQVNVTAVVTFEANVTDANTIDTVEVNVTFPNSTTQRIILTQVGSTDRYNGTFTVPNLQGTYNVSFEANDTLDNVNESVTTTIVANSTDADGDGVPDILDTLNGNESSVTTSGVSNLNITIGGSKNGTFTGRQEVLFRDGGTLFMNFTHNFSLSNFDLSRVSISVGTTGIVVNLSGQLQSGQTKTLFLTDNSFIGLCVRDQEIASLTDISGGCTGGNETNFVTCLGNSTGVTINGITCVDTGSTLRIENLSFSGVEGSQAAATSSSSGGGGGGGGRKLNPYSNMNTLMDMVGRTEISLLSTSQHQYTYKGINYTFRLGINTQLNGRMAIRIDPYISSLELKMKEPLDVDLDRNGHPDVRLTLTKRMYTSGDVLVEKLVEPLAKPFFQPSATPPEPKAEEKETITNVKQEPEVEDWESLSPEVFEENVPRTWWMDVGLAILIFLAIGVFYGYGIYKHEHIEHK